MPIQIVRDVAQRCKGNKLKPWEANLKAKNNLTCEKLGEAVASIVKNKMKKNSTFSRETEEEVYQSLFHVDPEEIEEILKLEEYKEDTKKTFDIKGKEVFSAGNWKKDKYTEQDLDAMIEAFNKLDFKPALKLHHEKNDENDNVNLLNPALGYVSNLYRKGKKLLADFSGIPKKVYEAIQNKAYNRVSSEIAWNFKRNGKTFKRALCAVSLLGADIPAVADLETLNGLYSYSEEDELHIYDLLKDNDEKLVDFGGVLDWDDTKDSYIYWAYKYDVSRNQIDNVSKEDIGDGVMKLFKSREIMDNETLENEIIKDIIGWQFAKNKYNLAQAKAWIHKRKEEYPLSESPMYKEEFQTPEKEEDKTHPIPESARDINNKKNNYEEENIMADEKLKETLEALQKQLSESQQKIEKLEARDIELETKEKQFAEKEVEFSKEKEDLETKLKETEEKQKEFEEKIKTLSEVNEKFEQEKQEAVRKAKEVEIKAFIDENKAKGKILPKFENYIKSLLSIEDTEKVCKFSVKEGDKEVEKEFSVNEAVKEIVKSLPDLAQLKELSVQEEETTGSFDVGDKLDKKIKAYAVEHKIPYGEAYDAVLNENPQLKQEYIAATQ